MARRNKSASASNTASGSVLRQRVAAEAARIMATEGQHQYLNAKQKAAQRLGADSRKGLPSNAEVAAALKDYLELFGGHEREQAVQQLLETALQAMRWLQPLSPRLSGAVVDGLADRHSPLQIHVFSDDPDAPLHFLMQRNMPYEQGQKRIRWYEDQYRDIATLNFHAGDIKVELWLFAIDDQRQAPPSPIDGRPRERLDLKAVEKRLAAQVARH